MVPVEALKLALSEENKAVELYQRLSVEHPVLKDTFAFLITEEQKHRQMLAGKITELTK